MSEMRGCFKLGEIITAKDLVPKGVSSIIPTEEDGPLKIIKGLSELLKEGKSLVELAMSFKPKDSKTLGQTGGIQTPPHGVIQSHKQEGQEVKTEKIYIKPEIDQEKLKVVLEDVFVYQCAKIPKFTRSRPLNDFVGENFNTLEINIGPLKINKNMIIKELASALAENIKNVYKEEI